MMRNGIGLLIFIFSVNCFSITYKIDLSSVGWKYSYLDSKIKNIHLFQNKTNEKQKAFMERKLLVLRPDEKFQSKKFWNRRCPKLHDQMMVEIDIKKGQCSQTFLSGGKVTKTIMLLQRRESKKSNKTFYWTTISFIDAKNYTIPKRLIAKIRDELAKSNF
jgi:hypothetical protein